MFVIKRFGTSPERHCLTAVPYRLFQGNLNPKDLKRHQIATQSFFFKIFKFFDTNQGRQTEIYAPELVTLVVANYNGITILVKSNNLCIFREDSLLNDSHFKLLKRLS